MLRKMIFILMSLMMTAPIYAKSHESKSSTVKYHTKISDFQLITPDSSPDCEKFFSQALQEKGWEWEKGEQSILPEGHKVKRVERVAKTYQENRQVLVRHQVAFTGGETADLIVSFVGPAGDVVEGGPADGLMMVINWQDDQGNPVDRVCKFSFKEDLSDSNNASD